LKHVVVVVMASWWRSVVVLVMAEQTETRFRARELLDEV
jgi:hypothetical protein